ncbi:hypothetical protein VB005_02647 [Metarhizium brunneum]
MPPNNALHVLVKASHFMVFASATIVTGILGWFLHRTSAQNTHVIFQETVAAVTVPAYLGHLVFAQVDSYYEQSLMVGLAFSYLWLTSFIFAAQDWTGGRCASAFPRGSSCSQKKAVVAFDFLAFFFLVFGMLIKGYLKYTQNKKNRTQRREYTDGVISTSENAMRSA